MITFVPVETGLLVAQTSPGRSIGNTRCLQHLSASRIALAGRGSIPNEAPHQSDLAPENSLDLSLLAFLCLARENTRGIVAQLNSPQIEIGRILKIAQHTGTFGQAFDQKSQVHTLFQRYAR